MGTTLARTWSVQVNVVKALVMREILTRYGRHNIGFLWVFVEPMIFTLGVAAIWSLAKFNHGSNLPIFAFALTGYSSVLLWRNMPARCIGAIAPNIALMYHRNVKMLDVFVARLLLEAAGATMSFAILGIFFWAVGWLTPPEDILKVFFAWVLLAWFGASLAILMGALSERSHIVEKLWHPAAYLLFPLSGAAFIVDALPNSVREVVMLLPMVHGVELLREGYFGSNFRAHYDVSYVILWCLALTVLGLAQVRATSRLIAPE
jgi:ABC-type polysaccharide/polyol phosphate export permease